MQKLTLLDYPGKVACTVFTAGCNFRCPFCHNASLVLRPAEQQLEEADFFSYLQKRRGVLDGVCVSGGEPLLQPELERFLERIRALGLSVKLDTNGSDPERLASLIARGLVDYVAMDIKNAPARYAQTVGIPGFDPAPVLQSAALLLRGSLPYEFRTTVVRGLHRREDFPAIADLIAGAQQYFLQGFVDSGDLILSGFSAFTAAEMADFAALVREKVPAVQLRGVDA